MSGPDQTFGRVDYTLAGLADDDATPDPMDLFRRWYDEARAEGAGIEEPNAMVLATAGAGGSDGPAARTVLLKGLDEGFTFYTNRRSAKGRALAADPRCALTFPWYGLQRQVRVEGAAHEVDGAPYFANRPRGSQLGAWASVEPVPQSGVVADRAALEAAYAAVEARFEGQEVPCPPTWGGYAVVPERIEFWQGRTGRMHDRLRYRRGAGQEWVIERLAP